MQTQQNAVTQSFELHDDIAASIEQLAAERRTTPRAIIEVAASLLNVLCVEQTAENPAFGVLPMRAAETPDAVTVYVVPMTAIPAEQVAAATAARAISMFSTSIDPDPGDVQPHLRPV